MRLLEPLHLKACNKQAFIGNRDLFKPLKLIAIQSARHRQQKQSEPSAAIHHLCPKLCRAASSAACRASNSSQTASQSDELLDELLEGWDVFDEDDGDPQARNPLSKKKARRKTKTSGCCYGCGVRLQTDQPQTAGYVSLEKFELKRQHNQLDQLLCSRCQELCNGEMVPGVRDFQQRQAAASGAGSLAGRQLALPEELREQLMEVRTKKALVLLLVDLLDVSGSFLSRVRDLVGANPVILLGTKWDLMPRGSDKLEVEAWLEEFAAFKRLNAAAVRLVSSRSGEGVAEAAGVVMRERRGRDVYILGAANVGKSAFVRALTQEMRDLASRSFQPSAMARGRFLPVESAMPGTTLQIIPVFPFDRSSALYDTPGVHLDHRMAHMLSPEELKAIHPRARLRPHTPPSPLEVARRSGARVPAATYLWGGLARIDVLEASPGAELVFFGPKVLRVDALPLMEGPEDGEGTSGRKEDEGPTTNSGSNRGELSEVQVEPFGAGSVAARGGLRVGKETILEARSGERNLGDIAISGVAGWIAVCSVGSQGRAFIRVRIWTPVGVETFVRPPLPVKV